jgi:hypothetical protein
MYVSLFTAAIPVNHTSELFCTWHQRFPGIFLKLCMLVFLPFIFLYRTRPCDGPIPRIRSHTKCSHYTVGGSGTYCSQDWFSHKGIVNISRVVQIRCSDQEERHIYILWNMEKIWNLTKNDNLRGGNSSWTAVASSEYHLQRSPTQVVMHEVPEDDLNKSSTESWQDSDFSFRISLQKASILIIPCLTVLDHLLFE